jgi:hypothetical protein
MFSWLNDAWTYLLSLPQNIDIRSALVVIAEKLLSGLLQAVAVVMIGWLVLYRQWRQLTQGRSDQVIFSANLLTPLGAPHRKPGDGERYVLQLRTVLPPKTVEELLDNVVLRRLTRRLADKASLADPILATEETAGFEILNDIVNCVAGNLASSSHRRDQWLLAATCEDQKVVRKCCIRVLLVRRSDIEHLASWDWCREHIVVEEWYHYWRIVTLHQIAIRFKEEQARQERGRVQDIQENLLPLVDRQAHHPRIRSLSLGINIDEPVVRPPLTVDWDRYLPKVAGMGLKLSGGTVEAGTESQPSKHDPSVVKHAGGDA